MYRRSIAIYMATMFMLSMILISCTGVQTTKPYSVVKVTAEQILYDARMLQNQGKITEQEFLQVKDIYDKIRAAQNLAINARLALIKVNSVENQEKVNVAVAEVARWTSNLISFVAQFGIGGEK